MNTYEGLYFIDPPTEEERLEMEELLKPYR